MGISAAVVGWGQLLDYPRELLLFSHMQSGSAMNPKFMPNLRGVISSFAGDVGFARALIALVSLALAALVAWRWQTDRRQPGFELAVPEGRKWGAPGLADRPDAFNH